MVVWKKCCSLLAYRYLRYLTHKFRTNCGVVGISWIVVERQVHKGFRWRHPELMSLRLEAMSKILKGNYIFSFFDWDLPVFFCLIFDLSQVVCTSSPAPLCLFWCAYPSSTKLIGSLKRDPSLSQLAGWIFHPQISPKSLVRQNLLLPLSMRGVGVFGWSSHSTPEEGLVPSRELTYSTRGKGKSSSKCHFWGIC